MRNASTRDNWTDERVARLKELWADGASAAEIANDLRCGISRSGVIGKAHRLNLPSHGNSNGGPKGRQATREKSNRAHGNKGAPKAKGIVRRVAARAASELPDDPFVETDDGVDVTGLVGIMHLDAHTCRWPVRGEGSQRGFCGDHPVEGKPYCHKHMARAYAKPDRHLEAQKSLGVGT